MQDDDVEKEEDHEVANDNEYHDHVSQDGVEKDNVAERRDGG